MDIGPRGIGQDYQRDERQRPKRTSGDFQRYFEQFHSNEGDDEERQETREPTRPVERGGDQVELTSGQALSLQQIIDIFQERMLYELEEFVAERSSESLDTSRDDPQTDPEADPASLTLEIACEHVARCAYRAFALTRDTAPDAQLTAAIHRALDSGLEQIQSILTGLNIRTEGVWTIMQRADARTRELLHSLPR